MTLTKDGNRTKEPCGTCRGPKESLQTLTEFYPFRTVLEMKALFDTASKETAKTESVKICNTASLKFVEVCIVFPPSSSSSLSSSSNPVLTRTLVDTSPFACFVFVVLLESTLEVL